MEVENQVLIIWSATKGYLDDVEVSDISRFERELTEFMANSHPGVLQDMREKKKLDDDLTASLKEALEDFKSSRWGNENSELSEPQTAAAVNA